MRPIQVAYIDDYSPYSHQLYENLYQKDPKILMRFYGPKKIHNFFYHFQNDTPVWSTHFYPFQLFRKLSQDDPDVVHVQYELNTYGPIYTNLLFPLFLLFLKILRMPSIITIHSVLLGDNKNILPKKLKSIPTSFLHTFFMSYYRLIGKLCDIIIVHSKVFSQSLIMNHIIPSEKIRVIPSGVIDEEPYIEPLLSRKWEALLDSNKIILFFGALTPRKGIDILIRSFAMSQKINSQYLLIIAGNTTNLYSDYLKNLKFLIKSLGVEQKVFLTGYISDEEMHSLFSRASIVVFPFIDSIGASSTLSVAIQYNKPIVATKTVFLQDTLKDGFDAILVQPNDSAELMNALELLSDASFREKLSNNLRFKKKEYSWKKVAESTAQIYSSFN